VQWREEKIMLYPENWKIFNFVRKNGKIFNLGNAMKNI